MQELYAETPIHIEGLNKYNVKNIQGRRAEVFAWCNAGIFIAETLLPFLVPDTMWVGGSRYPYKHIKPQNFEGYSIIGNQADVEVCMYYTSNKFELSINPQYPDIIIKGIEPNGLTDMLVKTRLGLIVTDNFQELVQAMVDRPIRKRHKSSH